MKRFPDDFVKKAHSVVPGATQWTLADDNGNVVISVVGGGIGLYGNGVTTFEMHDFREEDPQGYRTIEEINQHLEANPL